MAKWNTLEKEFEFPGITNCDISDDKDDVAPRKTNKVVSKKKHNYDEIVERINREEKKKRR